MRSANHLRSLVRFTGIVAASAVISTIIGVRPTVAQGEIDVTYRDTTGGITTETFNTQPNGSGPNFAEGSIWASYVDNSSFDGSSGNGIIVTPVVDPILDLTISLTNNSSTPWTEFRFTLPAINGIGFFNYTQYSPSFPAGITPTTGGLFSDFEFISPSGTLADDGTGNSRQLYSEIRFFNSNPSATGVQVGQTNVFRFFQFFPDPPPSGPVSYFTEVRPNNVPGRIPEPGVLALALSVGAPAAGIVLRRSRQRA
jgi:hypothetical protein